MEKKTITVTETFRIDKGQRQPRRTFPRYSPPFISDQCEFRICCFPTPRVIEITFESSEKDDTDFHASLSGRASQSDLWLEIFVIVRGEKNAKKAKRRRRSQSTEEQTFLLYRGALTWKDNWHKCLQAYWFCHKHFPSLTTMLSISSRADDFSIMKNANAIPPSELIISTRASNRTLSTWVERCIFKYHYRWQLGHCRCVT